MLVNALGIYSRFRGDLVRTKARSINATAKSLMITREAFSTDLPSLPLMVSGCSTGKNLPVESAEPSSLWLSVFFFDCFMVRNFRTIYQFISRTAIVSNVVANWQRRANVGSDFAAPFTNTPNKKPKSTVSARKYLSRAELFNEFLICRPRDMPPIDAVRVAERYLIV